MRHLVECKYLFVREKYFLYGTAMVGSVVIIITTTTTVQHKQLVCRVQRQHEITNPPQRTEALTYTYYHNSYTYTLHRTPYLLIVQGASPHCLVQQGLFACQKDIHIGKLNVPKLLELNKENWVMGSFISCGRTNTFALVKYGVIARIYYF